MSELNFGSGKVVITPCVFEGIGCLLLNKQGKHKVGEKVDTLERFITHPYIRFNFENTESIDVLVKNLLLVKDYMNGEYHEEELNNE